MPETVLVIVLKIQGNQPVPGKQMVSHLNNTSKIHFFPQYTEHHPKHLTFTDFILSTMLWSQLLFSCPFTKENRSTKRLRKPVTHLLFGGAGIQSQDSQLRNCGYLPQAIKMHVRPYTSAINLVISFLVDKVKKKIWSVINSHCPQNKPFSRAQLSLVIRPIIR